VKDERSDPSFLKKPSCSGSGVKKFVFVAGQRRFCSKKRVFVSRVPLPFFSQGLNKTTGHPSTNQFDPKPPKKYHRAPRQVGGSYETRRSIQCLGDKASAFTQTAPQNPCTKSSATKKNGWTISCGGGGALEVAVGRS